MQNKFTDQLGRTIILSGTPRRIISLVPSITETLIACSQEIEVVGRTKFCIHPSRQVENITKIGGTKHLKIDMIESLSPDLIIANKEENTEEAIQMLEKSYPVYVSDINDLKSMFSFLEDMTILLSEPGFQTLKKDIQEKLKKFSVPKIEYKVLYLIWRKPYMTVGGDTFIHYMLDLAGFKNVFENTSRYPTLTHSDVSISDADIIFLSSEPYPFKKKHIFELNVLVNKPKIRLVDGELFSWYGVRILKSFEYFKELHATLPD